MNRIPKLIALPLLFLTFISCSSNDDSAEVIEPVTNTDVYVAGYIVEGDTPKATLWKNGVQTVLTNNLRVSQANDVFVQGDDVYVVGYEQTNGTNVAKLWKNGVETSLSDGLRREEAIAVAVSGQDVYVIGERFEDFKVVPKLWKNGIGVLLPTEMPNSSERVTNITIHGGDIYISGYRTIGSGGVAKFWKNGQPINLTNGTTYGRLNDIKVIDNDVYAVGSDNSKAKCWKNEIAQPNLLDENNDYEAIGIAASGTDIYILGKYATTNANRVRLWKNGTNMEFPEPQLNFVGYDLAAKGSDSYACGVKYISGKSYAMYYKNQTPVDIVADAVVASFAYGIFVK